MKVLLVDDSGVMRKIIARGLHSLWIDEVIEAGGRRRGARGVRRRRRFRPRAHRLEHAEYERVGIGPSDPRCGASLADHDDHDLRPRSHRS